MGKTLIAAKPQFQKDLYDAIYDAYMTQFNSNAEAGSNNVMQVKKDMEDAAQKFANSLSKNLSNIIYNYIMEMQISITHTLIPGTINTPVMGAPTPAVGAISILPTEVKIS